MSLALIVAVSENGCIGREGRIPWHIAEDVVHFRKLIAGKIVLMGRKTWESFPERFQPLPSRQTIVLTHRHNYPLPSGIESSPSIQDALDAHPNDELFIIGGGEIYQQTIELADTLYVTRVHQEVLGDTYFPAIDPDLWHITSQQDHKDFSFLTYRHNLSD